MNKKKHNTTPYTFQEVKEYIEKFNYKLLSTEYINANKKLLIQCDKGHIYEATFSKFKNCNRRCPYCAREKVGELYRISYEEVREYIKSFGYELLSEEYINNLISLEIKCPKGHIFHTAFGQFKGSKNRKGSRCPHCNGGIKYTYEYVKKHIENENYELLSTKYVNCKEKLKLKCSEGHIFELNFDCFKQNHRCPICHVSKGERKVINWLDKNKIQYIYNKEYFKDLVGIGGGLLRPDFIIEDRKIWIEYDGEFHYKKYYEGQNYETILLHDEIKNMYAEKNGWKLIRIPYWEFDNIEVILEGVVQ